MIVGHGGGGARVAFILDAGSKDDAEKGFALSGAAEKLFRQLCNHGKIKLDECYRTCYVKEYLKGYGWQKSRDRRLIKQALAAAPIPYENILADEIRSVDPNVIVPLGDASLRFLTMSGPHSKFRGSIISTSELFRTKYGMARDYKVIPTFAPLDIYADNIKMLISIVDFKRKIVPQSFSPVLPPEESKLWICRTGEAAFNFFRRNRDAEFVACDIETFVGIPTCISFCFDGRESVSFPLCDPDIPLGESILIIHEVAKILASKIPKVGQNFKYDAIILERFGFLVNNIVEDTMLKFHTIYPELASRGGEEGTQKASVGYGKNLGFQASIYTNIPYFKAEGKQSISYPPDEKHLLYNAKDSLVTNQIKTAQDQELEDKRLTHFFRERVMPLFFMYKKMEERGIRVSEEKRVELRGKYEMLLETHQAELDNLAGKAVNARSNPQVGELVYETLKFPMRRAKKDSEDEEGQVSKWDTEEETLEELMVFDGENNRYGSKGKIVLEKIITVRKLGKILEYINTPIHPDGRLKCSWNIAGTETGRTSASKTTDRLLVRTNGKVVQVRLGRSLQTISKHGFKVAGETFGKDLRQMYVPSPGYIFIEADQSQAEARHVAVLANDYDTLAILEKTVFRVNKFGVRDDLHTITATWVTEKPFDEITPQDRQDHGKPARHGGAYGMSPKRFAMMYHKSLEQSVRTLDRFHKYSPKIKNVFWNEIRLFVSRHRYLVNPFGRRRDFFGRVDEEFYKQAYATLPQGTVSDHQKFAMYRTSLRCDLWIYFIVEAHDSALSEVPLGREREYAEIMNEELRQPINYRECSISRDFDLVVPADFQIGDNWGQMENYKL